MQNKITILNFTSTIVENTADVLEHREELQEQLKADVYYDGINLELKKQVIEELIGRLNELIPNIIIATHQ